MSTARLFYEDEATEYGMAEAVLINYLRLFLRGNKQRGNNVDEDGRVWTYTTYEQIAEEHTFWSYAQVGRLVRKLRDAGIIFAERRGYDGYTWFSFVDDSLLQIRSDVTTKSSAHQNEIVDPTYTEEILKKTKYPFGDVWDLYDKKVERKRSQHLWGKLSEKKKELVMKHIPLFVKATPDKVFRPALAVYLNGRRWEDDELPAIKGKHTPPWQKPEVTVKKVRVCSVCGGQASWSVNNKHYCEKHDQYT